jgi:hypothetical protein
VKGTRVWTCDGCGKRETWRKGWHYLHGVESDANRLPPRADGEPLLLPMAFCSDPCGDRWLEAWRAK